ncbi:MAG: formylglycine-generating enzyme family protein [Kiritimatiellae bacterium]|nr:formylglycine-generating enzyme family protein [Kiritimatiellia bacterium]
MKTVMIALAAAAVSGIANVVVADEVERVPGLTKAIFTGSEFDITSDVYSNAIARVDFPEEMYASSLPEKTTVAWAGYMEMEAGVKYNFKGCYDDFVAVKINGSWIISKGSGCQERSGSFTPSETAWYPVEFRVGNNGGPGGCQSSTYYGIVWNTSNNATWRSIVNGSIGTVMVGANFATLKNDSLPYKSGLSNEDGKVQVTGIKCQQRYPWNGMVDIDYTVRCEDPNAAVWVYPIGYDKDSNISMAPRSLTGDGVDAPVSNGTFRMTWKVTDDYPEFHSTAFTVKMIALTGSAPYMVVDLSGGVDAISYTVTYLSSVPEGGWGDEYKTTKLVLRLIPPGSFMMGSPSDEDGRNSYEDLHGVVLTKPFYIGVFEVTQKQYELVMGGNPSNYKGNMRPVERVSYNDIRGSVNGAGWPTHNQVDANSFMGRLRSKVNMLFDLPTEAQWEYACRAGTSSALNNGKAFDWWDNCHEVARWTRNAYSSGSDHIYDGKGGYTYTATVGCYKENAWGLYDMHGNVGELCKDFWNYGLGTVAVIDPVGANKGYSYGDERVYRGGHFDTWENIRSAYRYYSYMRAGGTSNAIGFRVFCSPVAE